MDRPKTRLAPALIVAGILLALPVAYVAVYFNRHAATKPTGERIYSFGAKWMCTIYWPAAQAESKITGAAVYVCYPTGAHEYTAYE